MSKGATRTACPDAVAAVYAALGSPTRMALMVRLVDRPFSINELADAIGAKQANVSQQLGLLKQAGLVTSVRTGTTVTYSTDGPEVNRIIDLALQLLCGIVSRRCASFGSGHRS